MTSNFHGEPRTDQGHAHGVEMSIFSCIGMVYRTGRLLTLAQV